jgi:ribosomal protein L7Ae-like RNA K-turn-binding protein
MNNDKLKTMLGLAQKAGKLMSGETGAINAIKSKKAKLILVAADASESARKTYRIQAENHNVEYKEVLTKEELGECIGKNYRAAVAVIDNGFAKTILTLLQKIQEDKQYM